MMTSEPPKPPYKHCLDCGYILSGLPGNRCPECGRDFDPERGYTFFTCVESGTDCLLGAFLGPSLIILPRLLVRFLGVAAADESMCALAFFTACGAIIAIHALIGGVRRLRLPPSIYGIVGTPVWRSSFWLSFSSR